MQHEHSVEMAEIYPQTFFLWKFREGNVCTKEITETVDFTKYFSVRVNFSFSNTVMVNQVIESICHSFSRRKCSAVLLRMLKSPPLFPHDLSRKFSLSKKTPNSHLENCYIMDNWTLIFQLHIWPKALRMRFCEMILFGFSFLYSETNLEDHFGKNQI